MTVTERILAAIRDGAITANVAEVVDMTPHQVSANLYSMRRHGHVVRTDRTIASGSPRRHRVWEVA